MNLLLQLLKPIFAFLEKLFTIDDDVESSGGTRNVRRPKPLKKYARLLLAFVILLFLVLAGPLGVGCFILKEENIRLAEAGNAQKEQISQLQKQLGENFTAGRRSAFEELILGECRAVLATYSDVLADIENDIYWPHLEPDGAAAALKSIDKHLTTLRRHLEESTKFNRWLNGRIPPEFHHKHAPVIKAIDLCRSHCVPQMKQATEKINLTLLKVEVTTALQDLIDAVKKVMAEEESAVAE